MKKTLSFILAVTIAAASLNAEEPQIAFRLLDDYVQNRQERLNKTMTRGAIVSMVCGAVFIGTAAVTFFAGDEISLAVLGEPMPDSERTAVSMGFGIGGAAFITSGAFMLRSPARDLRAEYSNIFQETDPVIQEAMAAATLKAMSDRARAARIGAVALELSAIALIGGLKIGANLYEGASWGFELGDTMQAQAWAMLGIIPTIFTQNEEEVLYAKYRAAREAIYSTTRPKSGEPKGRKFRIEVGSGGRGASLEIYTGPSDEDEEDIVDDGSVVVDDEDEEEILEDDSAVDEDPVVDEDQELPDSGEGPGGPEISD